MGNIMDGGFANLGSWVRNSEGTVLSASAPLICSLGIHPLGFMVLNQWASISIQRNFDQVQVSSRWNPSSQRNPRGNLDLDGDPVNSPVGSIY